MRWGKPLFPIYKEDPGVVVDSHGAGRLAAGRS